MVFYKIHWYNMPQLDLYIIVFMVYGVLALFIFAYRVNISNILIRINLLLRTRKLKIYLDKKYIFKKLKLMILLSNYRIQYKVFTMLTNLLKKLKTVVIFKDFCDSAPFKQFYDNQDKH